MLVETPKFVEKWGYFDEETNRYQLKKNAPEWAIKEAEEYNVLIDKPLTFGKWEDVLEVMEKSLKNKEITQEEFDEFIKTREFYE